MKKLIIVLFLLFFLITPTAFADTQDDLQDNVSQGLGSIDFTSLDEIANGYVGDIATKIQQIIDGQFDSADSYFQLIFEILSTSISELLPQLCSIFAVMVIVGLVRKSADGFISQGTDDVVCFVGTCVVLVSVITMVVDVVNSVGTLVDNISILAQTSMPIMLTLMIANGGSSISTVSQPMMLIFTNTIITIVQKIILPLTIAGMIFSLIGQISKNLRITKLTKFLNNSSSWLLGIMFTLFSAFTTIQGVSASVIDGVSFRMAKFTAKNYIPILGGYVSDGFDVIVASTSLIKNGFGVVLLVILFMMIAQPLIQIVSLNLGLQCVSAVAEPIIDDKFSKIFDGVCKSLTFLVALIFAVAFMFAILIFIAICCANGV